MSSKFEPMPLPDPAKIRKPPTELFAMEKEWRRWIGSATAIERIAAHAEHCIGEQFLNFNDPEFKELCDAAKRQGYPEPTQYAIFNSHIMAAEKWAGGVRSEVLGAEIEARRELTSQVWIKSEVIDRGWCVTIADEVPHRDPASAMTGKTPLWQSEASVPPQRIEVWFQRDFPAARLRVIAAGPIACSRLFGQMVHRVEAGSRPKVWSERKAALASGAIAALLPLLLYIFSVLTLDPALALLVAVVMVGMVVGSSMIPWAFPPLELVDAWERSRWQKLKAWTFQLATLGLAVAGVIVAVLLSQPKH